MYCGKKIGDDIKHISRDSYNRVRCSICLKDLNKNSLARHVKESHSSDSRKTKCLLCGKLYAKRSLKYHLEHYHGKKEVTKTKRNRHSEDDSSYSELIYIKCPIQECARLFRRHMIHSHIQKQHNGYYPHTCSWCGKTFETVICLRDHMLNH